uniref:Ribonuclease P protein subunit p30 n=1 Tax=Romanomermis culicivorax TaxID=13658 RepID=A0A915KLD6_ROMCU
MMRSTILSNDKIFADLNLIYDSSNPKATLECIKKALALGFDAIAVNVELLDYDTVSKDDNQQQKHSNKKKKTNNSTMTIPSPPQFTLDLGDGTAKKLKLYSRLTLGLADTSQVHNILKMPVVEKYDVLCIYPKTDEMFNTIIKKLEVDMITIEITQRANWISRKNLVQMAIEKGITFEITYSPALMDSSVRRDCFANGRDLHRASKGKGLILSSKASKPIEIRSPFDVANMGLLFGLTSEQSGRAVSSNALNLLLHAESRKTVKGVMNVQSCASLINSKRSLLDDLLKIPEFRTEVKVISTEEKLLVKKQKLT